MALLGESLSGKEMRGAIAATSIQLKEYSFRFYGPISPILPDRANVGVAHQGDNREVQNLSRRLVPPVIYKKICIYPLTKSNSCFTVVGNFIVGHITWLLIPSTIRSR